MNNLDTVRLNREGQEQLTAGLSISVVIPSWKGLNHLRENLPSVIHAARYYQGKTGAAVEILVVDDGSQDDTPQAIHVEFPEVELIERDRNGGFAAACNTGFKRAKNDLVALLNNDVRIAPDYFYHQSRRFAEKDVFAVTAKVFDWSGSYFTTGGRIGRFRRGFWSVYFNYDLVIEDSNQVNLETALLTAYAIGGFATYNRSMLDYLGGFNELLSPFHWEDIDLSYRGWKCGWKVLYEPSSRAFHRTSATINAHYKNKFVEEISFRNRLLFHWINLHSPLFFATHLMTLFLLTCANAIILNRSYFRSLFSAMHELGRVRSLRGREKKRSKVSDKEISMILKRFSKNRAIKVYYSLDEIRKEHPESM